MSRSPSPTRRLARRCVTPLLAALAVAGAPIASAQAQLITFQGPTCYDTPCFSDGFRFDFVAGGWGIMSDGNGIVNWNPSGGVLEAARAGHGSPPVVVTMTRIGGGTFDVLSLDAAIGVAGATGSSTLDLVGMRFGGGTVSQTLGITENWASYGLTGFANLTSVQFMTMDLDAGFAIDDVAVAVSAVPEPATLALLAPGLLGLAVAARRRTRRG